MKIIFTILGLICVGFGAVGIIIPVLPTVPFLLAATVLFAKGSEKFSKWFSGTKLYKNNLDSFVKSRGMTVNQKIKILIVASIMLIAAFFICSSPAGKIVIAIVFVLKYYYFLVRIKTLPNRNKESVQTEVK